MLETLRKHELEVLIALLAAVALYFAVKGGLAWYDARNSYNASVATQQELEAEAARYDLSALTQRRDSLLQAANASVFPTYDQVEQSVGDITDLISDPSVNVANYERGDVEAQVTDANVGVKGSDSRTYQAVEMSLTLNGDASYLLNVANRLLNAVPTATFGDVGVTIGTAPEPSSLKLQVLLYYKD